MADAPDSTTPQPIEVDPRQQSTDYKAQEPYWTMVNAILQGAEALRATAPEGNVAGPTQAYAQLSQLWRVRGGTVSPWLPRFENETQKDYDRRRANAPLTNIYNDISKNLASKPFSKTLELAPDTPDDLKMLAENIDGQGNNLHVFAAEAFKNGIDKAIDWIWVDYPTLPNGPITLDAERKGGVRPYWIHIPAERLLAVYSDFIGSQEIIYHARILETASVCNPETFEETTVERVRVLCRDPIYEVIVDAEGNATQGAVIGYSPAEWELYEQQERADPAGNKRTTWAKIAEGPITIGIIPLVPFKTGKRAGASWRVDPPLRDLAFLQITEFQQESNLDHIKELTAFPMAAGQGVNPPTDANGQQIVVPIGPNRVVFAPPDVNNTGSAGRWEWMEPAATSLNFLSNDLDKLRTEMRDLGMQPLATANLTVITTANVSMKAHNAVQAWALGLKDALEQAWIITCMWLKQNISPVVNVHTDFGVDFEAGSELQTLDAARARKDLSQETYWDELKRRGVLSDDFDDEAERVRLAEETQGLAPETLIDPVTGKPILVDPLTGQPLPNQPAPMQQQPPPAQQEERQPPPTMQ